MKLRNGAAIGLILVSLGGSALSRAQTGAMAEITDALRSRNFGLALERLKPALRRDPRNPRLITLDGLALSGEGRSAEALAAFKRALALSPDFIPALEGAAQLEFRTDGPRSALYLEKLIRLNPRDQASHAMLGVLAVERGDCPAAVRQFAASTQMIAKSDATLTAYGNCLFRLGRFSEAVGVYRRLIVLQPNDRNARFNLGVVQAQAHEYANAIQTLEPLTRGESADPEALRLMATIYETDHQAPQAVAALERAIALVPRDPTGYLYLAALRLKYRDFKSGLKAADAGLRADPNNARLYIIRGMINLESNHYQRASKDFGRAKAINPLQNSSSIAEVVSLLHQSRLTSSLQLVSKQLSKSPDSPILNYLLAEIYLRQGVQPGTPGYEKAIAAAQRALKNWSGFTLVADDLTELYLRGGKIQLAEATARQALRTDPNDPHALDHMITCLREEGRAKEAAPFVARVKKITALKIQQEASVNRSQLMKTSPAPAGNGK